MKKHKSTLSLLESILKFEPDLKGVFQSFDLYNIIGFDNPVSNQKAIDRLCNEGILKRIKRGVYISKNFDLWQLAQTLQPQSYISLHSVLAKNGLTGTLSHNRVDLITNSSKKTYTFQDYQIRFFTITEDLFFGFQKNSTGIQIADIEKAYLDILSYYIRGTTFPIDPLNEIDTKKLNLKKLSQYLKRYKNPKFIQFVKGQLR